MRRLGKLVAAVLSWLAVISQAEAIAMENSVRLAPQAARQHISFDMPSLPPFEFSAFCLRYPPDCQAHQYPFRKPRQPSLTGERLMALRSVNLEINRSIVPFDKVGGVLNENWSIMPRRGDCADYAVTKRHVLLKQGWPARSLLLAEVVTSWGEHHLVLVVRFSNADIVLDNLNQRLVAWSRAPYKWVRAQDPIHPASWSTIG